MEEDLTSELWEACVDRSISAMLSLIDRGADIHSRDSYGWIPLHHAWITGHTDIALLLLDRGADIHSRDDFGRTLLHWACQDGHTDIALLLLDRGADINCRNSCEWTPLHFACQEGHTDIALALVRAGADTLAKIHYKTPKTPLDYAKSEELKAALIREREKYLAWTRRKAFMMFLVSYRYIAMRHHQPQAAAAADHGEEEPLVDRVMRMRELNMTIASFL